MLNCLFFFQNRQIILTSKNLLKVNKRLILEVRIQLDHLSQILSLLFAWLMLTEGIYILLRVVYSNSVYGHIKRCFIFIV